jgi:hypothetical protein
MRFAFEPSHKGVSRKLLVSREEYLFGFPMMFEAIEETNLGVAELSAYAGYYWSDELRVSYTVVIREGQLWLKELIGADGIVHGGTIRSNVFRPVLPDEFDLSGAPILIRFTRDGKHNVTGFILNGFGERNIIFTRVVGSKSCGNP